MIALVDYGLGNIRSVSSALKEAGADVIIVNDGPGISGADAVVVPGVGAFAKAMENIRIMGLYEPLNNWLRSGKPYLGICLGMQMLFSESHEHGNTLGFNIIKGQVTKFLGDVKIPHMGWNQVTAGVSSRMLQGIKPNSFFYFDHSYYTEPYDMNVAAGITGWSVWRLRLKTQWNWWGTWLCGRFT